MAEPSIDTPGAVVAIDYTNYRGERSVRAVLPTRIWFGETDWHSGAQWLLEAEDVARGVARTFAMKDIHSWGSEEAVDTGGA